MLEEIEKEIENFKLISEKDKQLYNLKNKLQAAKTSYSKVTDENKHLKQHTVSIKQKQKYRQELQHQQQQQEKVTKILLSRTNY